MIEVSELMEELTSIFPAPRSYEPDYRPAINTVAAKIRKALNQANEAINNEAAARSIMEEQARELARVRFELAETIERARLDNLKHLDQQGWTIPPEQPAAFLKEG